MNTFFNVGNVVKITEEAYHGETEEDAVDAEAVIQVAYGGVNKGNKKLQYLDLGHVFPPRDCDSECVGGQTVIEIEAHVDE